MAGKDPPRRRFEVVNTGSECEGRRGIMLRRLLRRSVLRSSGLLSGGKSQDFALAQLENFSGNQSARAVCEKSCAAKRRGFAGILGTSLRRAVFSSIICFWKAKVETDWKGQWWNNVKWPSAKSLNVTCERASRWAMINRELGRYCEAVRPVRSAVHVQGGQHYRSGEWKRRGLP